MKQNKLFKLWLLAVILFACSGMTWGTTVNYAMSSLGLDNGIVTGTGSYTVDAVISISFEKNSAATVPTYYTADGVRLYQNATKGGSMKISVANGYKITDVVVTRAGTAGVGPAGYSIDNTTEAGTFADGTVTNSINSINATSYVEYYSKGTSSGTRTYIASIAVTYTSGSSTPTVATPSFSPGTGNYLTTQNVIITTATEGATIRYTTNGAEPTETSTEYTTPIVVSSTTTLIAKAFKAGMDPSAVAAATYSFPVQVANIAGFLATSETGNVAISGPVTVVYQNGQNLYVQDASGSLLVYGSTGKTFVNGDQLTGLMGIRDVYGGSPQMTNPVAPDATSGSAVSPLSFDLSGVTTSDLAKYVKVENVQFTADVTFSTSTAVNGTLVAPAGFTVRDNFRLGGSVLAAKNYDIIGFISYFNGTAQLFPVSITEVATTTPSITATPTSLDFGSVDIGAVSAVKTVTVTGTNLTAAPAYSVNNTEFSVTGALTTAGGILTVTYTPAAAGAGNGIITISGDDKTATVNLSGTGVIAPLDAPIAVSATSVSQSGFTANWGAVTGATGYEINVYTKEVGGDSEVLSQEFTWTENGTGGNDDLWSGSIAGSTKDIATDIPGWTFTSAYKGNNCIKMGAGSTQGVLTTPALGISGNATLTFRAAAWNGTNEQTELLLEISGGGTLDQTSVAMVKGAFTDYTVAITGATAETKITFKGKQASNSRFFLDDVLVSGSAVAITHISGSPFTSATTSQTVSGLNNSLSYYYSVIAVRGEEKSPVSNEIGPISILTGLADVRVDALAWTSSGKVMLNASAGEVIEIFNVAGQKVVSRPAVDGLNSVDVSAKGVVIVKVNNRISKVIL